MKSIQLFIMGLKNLIPYLLLIVIYFFFVNFEAKKDNRNRKINEKKHDVINDTSNVIEKQQRIKIPVIPYQE